jgi:hypothetical protein
MPSIMGLRSFNCKNIRSRGLPTRSPMSRTGVYLACFWVMKQGRLQFCCPSVPQLQASLRNPLILDIPVESPRLFLWALLDPCDMNFYSNNLLIEHDAWRKLEGNHVQQELIAAGSPETSTFKSTPYPTDWSRMKRQRDQFAGRFHFRARMTFHSDIQGCCSGSGICPRISLLHVVSKMSWATSSLFSCLPDPIVRQLWNTMTTRC